MLRYIIAASIAVPATLLVIVALGTTFSNDKRTGWVLVSEPEGTTLFLAVTVLDCDPFDHFNITETSKSVTINAYSGPGRKGCGDDWGAAPDFQVARLQAPLGDRSLHGCNAELLWDETPNEDCRHVAHLSMDYNGDSLESIIAASVAD